MKAKSDLYDFSDYPRDHPNYNPTNKKVVGKFKDESMSKPMTGFVALRQWSATSVPRHTSVPLKVPGVPWKNSKNTSMC